MGSLQQVKVLRCQDGVSFTGYAWSLENGTFECFWDERGIRHNYYFDAEGQQLKVMRKTYEVKFP
jgi:hypothetical protein